MPIKTPMAPERMIVRQCLSTSSMRGTIGIEFVDNGLDRRAAHGLQHLRNAVGADERRQQADAAGKVREAEGEALIVVVRLLADGRDPEAEEAGEIALERIAAGQRAGDDDAEHRDPEELEALERQRQLAQHGRQQREAQDAEQRAQPGAGGRDAHGAPGEALARQRIAVERGARRMPACREC